MMLMLSSSVAAGTIAEQLVSEKAQPHSESHYQNKGLALSNMHHSVSIKLAQLSDNAGLNYIGGVVAAKDLSPYLAKLKVSLGDEFSDYREAQKLRDHSQFHITLVNPYEYKALTLKQQKLIDATTSYKFKLLGLGHVNKGPANTYFVVAQSEQAQELRKQLGLKPKDFHATLGFNPQDIYGVAKDTTTLVK